jgi:hypothetical protein
MSSTGIFLSAGGAIILLLLVAEGIARAGGGAFLPTVVLGEDKRTSTSKTFILLWTLLVGWALISLLIAGEFVGQHGCVTGPRALAIKACMAGHDDVGLLQLGWTHFLHIGLIGSYLVLLGIPAAAGVSAKGITQSKVLSGQLTKTAANGNETKLGPRLAQVFSADDGTTDIGDFQYLIFNLITAIYFVSNFVNPDGNGLPMIPDTLLGLTGVSAALYVGKKAVTRGEPAVTGVFPSILRPGEVFAVVGTNLSDPSEPGPNVAAITINGVQAANVEADNNIPDRLMARAPAGMNPLGTPAGTDRSGKLQVSTSYGSITKEFEVRCT